MTPPKPKPPRDFPWLRLDQVPAWTDSILNPDNWFAERESRRKRNREFRQALHEAAIGGKHETDEQTEK